jgi:hypothetical protein
MTINKLSALIVLFFAGCNSFASAEQMRWIEYRPAGEGFRVEMPENPEIVSNEINSKFGSLKQIVAKVDLVDRWFAVAYLDVPEEKSSANDVETQLDGARDGAVRGSTTDGNKATSGASPLRSRSRRRISSASFASFRPRFSRRSGLFLPHRRSRDAGAQNFCATISSQTLTASMALWI